MVFLLLVDIGGSCDEISQVCTMSLLTQLRGGSRVVELPNTIRKYVYHTEKWGFLSQRDMTMTSAQIELYND